MGKKNIARDPLLYIHQPVNRQPEAPMQYSYVTPKKSGDTVVQPKSEAAGSTQSARPIKRGTYYKELDGNEESENEETVDESVEDGQPSMNEDKKFKDMTIKEKVAYFADNPNYAPKVKCEVKTEDKTYRGIITDFEENIVYMRFGNRSVKTQIPLDNIKNIRMLGF